MGRIALLAAAWSVIGLPLRHRHLHWPLRVDLAFGVLNVPAEPSLFIAAVMFLLAGALHRRIRAAMLAAVLFEAVVGVLQLVVLVVGVNDWDGLPTSAVNVDQARLVYVGVAGVLGVVLAILMWRCRDQFLARLRPGSLRAAVLTLAGGLAAAIVITIGLTEAFSGTLPGHGQRALWAVRMALGAVTDVDTIWVHGHHGPHWVATLAGLLSAFALLAAVWIFTRSARAKQSLDAADELALRRLLSESGERDSLGYFATRRDRAVIFSHDQGAAVSYRVVAAVSLASADPIGPVQAWPAAIQAWRTEAREHGWSPAVLGASEAGARAYAAAGLQVLSLGDEAVVQVEQFSLRGPAVRPVRQAVTRIRRAGYTLQVRRHADIAAEELASLGELAERWRGDAVERGFSMALNRLGDPTDERCLMATAHDATGAVRGLLSFVPWGYRGLSLDLMRRDHDAENGLIEFLVAGLIGHCPQLGIRQVSLNFAMFRSVFSAVEQVGAGPVVRLTGAVLSVASRFWQIETLYRSNAKYLPDWLPRFMCYESPAGLARVTVAAGMAEGFLPGPQPVSTYTARGQVPGPDGHPVTLEQAVRAQDEQLGSRQRPVRRLSQQQRTRQHKIEVLLAEGQPPYPVRVPRTDAINDICRRYCGLPAGQTTARQVGLTGRVRALRNLGGVTFAVLTENGAHIQVMLTAEDTPPAVRLLCRRTVDIGDLLSVSGEVVASKRGELSVLVADWTMAGKCLHPLPDPHAGLADPQARVRSRHLDLIMNDGAMATLRARSATAAALRSALGDRGFTEVETPMLQAVHGAPVPGRFAPTARPSAPTCTCGSRPSFTSNGSASLVWAGSSSSTATSATRAPTPLTTPSSPLWRCIRRTPTTPTCGS
jgi:lysyl-tRNA synthetase class 2